MSRNTIRRTRDDNGINDVDFIDVIDKIKENLSDVFQQSAEDVRGKTSEVFEDSMENLKHKTSEIQKHINDFTVSKPLQALTIALGVGFMAGYWINKRS